MKTLQTFLVCAVMLFTTACSNDEIAEETLGKFSVEGTIVGAAPISRAQISADGSGTFVSGDINTLFFHNDGLSLCTMDYEYGKNYYWYDLSLPTQTTTCEVSACYPTVKTLTPTNFEWNVTTQSSNPDLLVAAPVQATVRSTSKIDLTFGHIMHKMVVELVSENSDITDEVLKTADITFANYKPTAVVNLLTGKASSAKGENSSSKITGKRAEFIVPAQEVGNMSVTVALKGKSETFNLSECKISGHNLISLESGKTFVLKVKAVKGGFVIGNQSITAWGSQGEHDGTIII